MTEVRPLRWHDLPFAYRLIGQGAQFDSQLSLTAGSNSLRHAVLTGMGRTNFYFLRHPEGDALGQLHFPLNSHHARLAYISPSPLVGHHEDLLLALIDGLTIMAGRRKMTSLTAEVDEQSAAVELLRHADFAVYSRQDLWKRDPAPVEPDERIVLRPSAPQDEVGMQVLYSGLVPTMIQQVEDPPMNADDIYIVEGRKCDICGVVAVYHGIGQALIDVYLHPEIHDQGHAIINRVLVALQADTKTIYCRLRRYMGWLQHALVETHFQVIEAQAVMTRHTARRISQPAFKPLKVDGKMSTIAEARHQLETGIYSEIKQTHENLS